MQASTTAKEGGTSVKFHKKPGQGQSQGPANKSHNDNSKDSKDHKASNPPKRADKDDPKKKGKGSSKKNSISQPTFKVVIRKLPSKDFGLECFTEVFHNFLERLHISLSDADILRFMEGKLSRKRGPVPGACFISFKNAASFHVFTSNMKRGTVPFLVDELPECQPVVEVAAYQRVIDRDRYDKLEATIDASNDYKAFCERLDAPVEKRQTAEARLEAGDSLCTGSSLTEKEKDPKMSALVVFLREQGRKQMELKKLRTRAKEQESKSRSGRSGPPSLRSKEVVRSSTAPSGSKAGSSGSGRRSGGKPPVSVGGSTEKPKSVAKMTILQRKPAGNDAIASEGKGSFVGGGGNNKKEKQGSNNKKDHSETTAAAPGGKERENGSSAAGKFKQQGEEKKKRREKLRTGAGKNDNIPSSQPAGV